MNTQHTRPIRRVLAVILSLALLLTFTPLSGVMTLTAGATSNAYTFVKPDLIELTPNTELTAVQFDMSQLDFTLAGGDRTPYRIRLVLECVKGNTGSGTLTNQQDTSKTITFGLKASTDYPVQYQNMMSWTAPNNPKYDYIYISPEQWNAAVPGTYTGTISYNMMWGYASNPSWSDKFDYGTIPITVTIPEPGHPVTVTAEPSEGGTVSGARNYEEGTQVNLTPTPSDGWRFKEWQVVSGGVTIENDSFTMPDHAVEVKAVFEEKPTYPVTVTAEPSEGGTVEGAGAYKESTQVYLTPIPSDGYFFKEWQIVSGGVTIENDSFTMPDHAVEVKAVFGAIIPPQFTYNSGTKELHLISGDFGSWRIWGNVPKDEVLSVTADKGVRFVGNCTWLFTDFIACERMELSAVDTSQATNMDVLFYNCNALTSLDLSGWDTGAVKGMCEMFHFCNSLTNLDLSGWDTGKVTNMSSMFSDCKSLVALNLSGFDTGKVTDMSSMFNGCESLVALDLSGFDTVKVNTMRGIFSGCRNLLYLDVRGFNTSAVTDMWGMFSSCEKITELDLSSFDTRCANKASHIFNNCSSLCRLTLSPHMALTEDMCLDNGDKGWVAEGEGTVVSGDGVYAAIAAPEQVTTFVWRNMPERVFIGHSVSLGDDIDGDIGLNFYINRSYLNDDETVDFEWYFKGEKKTASEDLFMDYYEVDCLRATCHLSADEINCAVKLTLIRGEDYYYDVCYPSQFAYRITDQTDEHASVSDIRIGDLSLGTKKAFSGYEVKLYLSVDEGYMPDQITLTAQDGTDVPYTLSNDNGEYFVTFTMPEQEVTVAESSKEYSIGDVNLDGRVDIRDVTAIQRHIAEIEPLSGQALALADVNGDGEVDIDDATHLLMYLAEFDVVPGEQHA